MLFGLVYSPRSSSGAEVSSPLLFTDWQPPVEFEGHWDFAAGGGMGLVEADNSGALEKALAPFTPFFEFKLELIDGDAVTAPTARRTLAA